MSASSVHSAAALLSEARIRHRRIASLPVPPASQDEAYAAQDALIGRLLEHYGGNVAGYKVACTNPIAQQQLGVDGPFSGCLLSPVVWASPAVVNPDQFFMRVIEAEFAFRMGTDLPATATPRSREEIAEAVEGVLPAFEIVDSRYDSWTTTGAVSLIADNACNGAWVHGPLLRNWRSLDLGTRRVQVFVNDQLTREGTGAAVLGHPLNALQWLVNKLNGRGIGVHAGQYMTTGVVSEVYMAESGDRICADFESIGRVELTFR